VPGLVGTPGRGGTQREDRRRVERVPRDLDDPGQRGRRGQVVEPGRVERREDAGRHPVGERVDERVPAREVRVDGLPGDAGSRGDGRKTGVRVGRQDPLGRGKDARDVASGVGAQGALPRAHRGRRCGRLRLECVYL
jgi:hypothetical protein